MMRNFGNFNRYLNSLLKDDYGQPPDEGHEEMIKEVMDKLISNMDSKTVLDVGCGATAIAEPYFTKRGIEYTGVSLGRDAELAKEAGKNVIKADMTFLDAFEDESFDLIWARHVVEHSPMPLITLFEFYRVSKAHLCLIVPKPAFFGRTARQHYSVLYDDQWQFLMERAGWGVIWEDHSNPQEYRFLAEKKSVRREYNED
jgi:ubiquinone/menaquinone biosynthesis C-methylase UbiE